MLYSINRAAWTLRPAKGFFPVVRLSIPPGGLFFFQGGAVMRRIERLRREALRLCAENGHKMARFVHVKAGRCVAVAGCVVCAKTAVIDEKPNWRMPEMYGHALEADCD